MRVIDVLSSPWAIVPSKLLEIQAIYATHLRGEKIDLKGIEAKIGQPLQNEPQGYEVQDGVAIIPVDGVISKRMNLFTRISGGASTELIGRDIRAALADPAVHALILRVDSPGGTVDGTQELAQLVYGARGSKPIATYVDGMMASAAYWIGSAADKAWIGTDTTAVGSIGVVASHTDYSRYEENMGIKTTEIYAGKYKRIASEHQPLTEDGRQYIQDMVDYLYSVFVADVAKQRGTDTETVLKNMADGRIFTGQQAVSAGLVDGVSTLDQLIADLGASRAAEQQRRSALHALNAQLRNPAPVRA
jgi:signal peptide peptidase SppA